MASPTTLHIGRPCHMGEGGGDPGGGGGGGLLLRCTAVLILPWQPHFS